jgi:Flp pilus assembly protein TadD
MPEPEPQKAREPPLWERWPRLSLLCVSLLVYAGNLGGPLLFDDAQSITENTTLAPLGSFAWLMPPRETPVAGRPLPNLTFALNHALFGDSPFAYHLVNLLFHLAVSWLGFSLVRITLVHGRVPESLRERAPALAFAAALLFAVHPVGVELVLYATQRTESLLAIFYLGALLLVAHAAVSGRCSRGVLALAVLCTVLGAGSKEVFATAPLCALFYDRAFFAGGFLPALRARKALYAALSVGYLPIVLLQRTDPRPGSVRFFELDYLVAQARIVPGYLGHALWPAHPQLDYGMLVPQDAHGAWPWIALCLLGVMVATWAAFARPRAGFLGVCVLGVLAPSSSLFSVHTEVGAERRIYLPLVAIAAYVVVALVLALRRLPLSQSAERAFPTLLCAGAVIGLVLSARAYAESFATAELAWRTAVQARPDNPRAHYNLAETLRRHGRPDLAEPEYRAALRCFEGYADAHSNLASVLAARGALPEALRHAARAAQLAPRDARTRYDYGVSLAISGDLQGAVRELTEASTLAPNDATPRIKLAQALLLLGEHAAAAPHVAWLKAHAPNAPATRALVERLAQLEGR